MKKFNLAAKIILAVFCIAAVIAWSSLYKLPQEIKADIVSMLEQKKTFGIQRLDEQIESFDRRIADIEAKMVELEGVLPQVEPWFTEKKRGDYSGVPCG
jgi:hypothetical protein